MKHIINYLGALLAVVLIGATFTACSDDDDNGSANVGLGIKVFAPTKVVTNQPMTINGSGFNDVTEVEFPGGVKVTDFEIVSEDMIRVNAPAGIAAEGGTIKVRTAADVAESRLPLTIGSTKVTGFSKQPGEEANGGELITVYGTDLEFINGVELLDAEGEPQIIDQKDFYRKGTSNLVFRVPKKNIYEDTFVGKLHTYDGKTFNLPELAYKPASDGGHWELKEITVWEGNFKGDWGNGLGIEYTGFTAIEGFDVGDVVRVYVSFDDDSGQLQFLTGSWNNDQQFPDLNLEDGQTITSKNLTEGGYFEVEVTSNNYPFFTKGDIWGGKNCIMFQGNNLYNLTKVSVMHNTWIEGGEGGGGDLVTTIWGEETVFDGWSATILIGADQFATVKAGDIIRVYTKDKGDDYNPIFKHENWSDWTEFQSIKVEGDGYFEAEVTDAVIAELQEKGLRFQGVGFTIVKVDLIQPGAGGGNAGGDTVIWDEETVFDGWSATIAIDAAKFANAKAGDMVRVYIKDKGDDYNPIYKHVSSWGDWTEFQSNKTDTDEYFEAPIPSDALEELNTDGLRFQGVGFTIVKVELIPE